MILPTDKNWFKAKGLVFLLPLFAVFAQSCEEIPNKFETEDSFIPMTAFMYADENVEEFSSFIAVMEASDMVDALSSYNPNGNDYTLFLPTNAAFERYFQENDKYNNLDDLLADEKTTHAMSRYHVANIRVFSNDFPLGALPDTSLTGDFLTIAYVEGEDSTYYKVNNVALVEREDLEMTNGVIHVIDQVLEPITFSGYDWVQSNPDYSIMAELMRLTGLEDTLAASIVNEKGEVVKNPYSLLLEADSIYNKEGYFSAQDVIDDLGDGTTDYTEEDNPIYQFVAYHVMAEAIFLADLRVDDDGRPRPFNYNTFAAMPVQITAGLEITVNKGVEIFDSIPRGDGYYDYIDYLEIMVSGSNVQTKNGPIHMVNRVMELFRPNQTQRTFQFHEEPVIQAIMNEPRTFVFKEKDMEDFTVLSWSGLEELNWVKSSSSFEYASYRDYILVEGDFSIKYELPQVLPGRYGLQLRANSRDSRNATVEVFLDGKKIGGNVNLTAGARGNNPYLLINLGIVELNKYEKHMVEVRSLIPGRFVWDFIRFENNMDTYNSNN